jgi:hypothetical protein
VRKIAILVFALALCLATTACNAPVDTPAEPGDTGDELDNTYSAYSDALRNLFENKVLPDGTDAPELLGDISLNQFAIYDVDCDGKDELILIWTNTYTAGQTGYIFAYNPKTRELRTELSEFTCLTFYDNGIVKALWSHNQGRAGSEFWPYNLYQYVPETDSYVFVGMVDAWDRRYGGTNPDESFPSHIDKSGTGYVYYIMEDGRYDTSHPVDASEYNAWVDTYLKKASVIEVGYMDLTDENIRSFYPPKGSK